MCRRALSTLLFLRCLTLTAAQARAEDYFSEPSPQERTPVRSRASGGRPPRPQPPPQPSRGRGGKAQKAKSPKAKGRGRGRGKSAGPPPQAKKSPFTCPRGQKLVNIDFADPGDPTTTFVPVCGKFQRPGQQLLS